ncbi:MAG: cysteine synthase A [Chlorobi bacterium]|nr:cysteine synthase A [Chlorobiota bacterium]
MKVGNVLELIGHTPVVHVNRLFPESLEIWIKLEKQNPGGSIKDRIALAMIEDAEKKDLIGQGSVIIEPTSGNTGIGLALVSSIKGYRLILVMPESMSVERRKQMQAYGAEIILTPKEKGMKGAIEKAFSLQKKLKGWMPMQFENKANPEIHRKTTAVEILDDFPDGLDYIFAGVGTGGHLTGVARVLKKSWTSLKVIAVEPADSPVISGGAPGPHPIQGIGAGFIPDNLDDRMIDDVVRVSKAEAYTFTTLAAAKEGLFIGISSGASLAAVAQRQFTLKGKRILTFAYDTGERYLSVNDLF